MKKILVFAGIFLAVGAALKADLYIKSKEHSGASPMNMPILPDYEQDYSVIWEHFMGAWHLVPQPVRNVMTEDWIGDDAYASVTGPTRTVLDFGKKKIYIINNADKSYFEADLPLDISKLLPLRASPMAVVTKAAVHAAPNGKTKTIGRWRCTGYIGTVTAGSISAKVAIWTTKDVDATILKYLKSDYPDAIKRRSIFWDMAAVKDVAKIDGLPIAMETTVNIGVLPGQMKGPSIHSTMKVAEIALKTPPAGLYAVPVGYRKIDILSMKDVMHLAR